MPGLAGFTCGHLPPDAARRALAGMRALLSHGESRRLDELFCDGRVCATRSHTNITQPQPQPHSEGETHVWLDGEFFNREELARTLPAGEAPTTDPALLLALYRREDDFSFLKQIDGVYAAVIYDAGARSVHLIGDRYGLRHLSWATHAGGVAWASEVKAALELPGFEPKIERASLQDFFETGNLTGERTWLEGVELLPAATVLTWDLDTRSAHKSRYWSADEIAPLPGGTDAVELAEELGRLFRAAVERRCRAGERIGLTLSGGLDSRAILAAIPERGAALHAVTFGKRNCEDARIAALAAARKGATHQVVEMDAAGWLAPRPEAVWWTDGECDLMHMHVLAIASRAREWFDIGLDGLGANGIIGDSWVEYGMSGAGEYIDTRTRRFLVLGPTVVRGFVEERFPFLDNRFVELALAAPGRLKANNALYRMMLLKTFPRFFEDIPWQKTGVPVSWPLPSEGRRKHFVELKDQLRHKLGWYGIANPPSRGYADYASWMRQEPARSIFREVLANPSALYPEFVPRERVEGDLAKHFGGRDRAEFLCRALTFEIWLRQVFKGEYRSAPPAHADLVGAG
jgi:asparagine synthase (glutamine-hydrolysing)